MSSEQTYFWECIHNTGCCGCCRSRKSRKRRNTDPLVFSPVESLAFFGTVGCYRTTTTIEQGLLATTFMTAYVREPGIHSTKRGGKCDKGFLFFYDFEMGCKFTSQYTLSNVTKYILSNNILPSSIKLSLLSLG